MVYECEYCEAVLGPGLGACPFCGQVFDEAVPDDALWDGPVAVTPLVEPEEAAPPEEVAPPEEAAPPTLRTGRRRWPQAAAALLLLLGLGSLGFHQWKARPTPIPIARPTVRPLTDLAAHPDYAAHMTALVQKLRATGAEAEWPAFGSDDILLITPQARGTEPPVAWDRDMDRRLAQGVYGDFAQTRFESGFPDGDTTACFVLVTGARGKVMAVDFMGQVE